MHDETDFVAVAFERVLPSLAIEEIGPVLDEMFGIALFEVFANRRVYIAGRSAEGLVEELTSVIGPQEGDGAVGRSMEIEVDFTGFFVSHK